jgi:hypothetical protein
VALESKLKISADVGEAVAAVDSLKAKINSAGASTRNAFADPTAGLRDGLDKTQLGLDAAYKRLRATPVAQVKAQLAEIRKAYEQVAEAAGKGSAQANSALVAAARQANLVARRGGLTSADAAGSLGLDQAGFDKALGRTQNQFNQVSTQGSIGFGKLTGAVALAQGAVAALEGAVNQLATRFASFVAQQDKFSEIGSKIGQSAQAVAEYNFVLGQTDATLSDFAAATRKLQQNLIAADDDGSTAAQAFKQVGIEVRDSLGNLKSSEQILDQIADAVVRLGTEEERTAFLTATLGKNGQALKPFFELGAQGIRSAREEARALGATLSEDAIQKVAQLDNELKKLSAASGGNLDRAFSDAVPPLTELVRLLTQDLANGGQLLGGIFKDSAESALTTYQGYQELLAIFNELISSAKAVFGSTSSTTEEVTKQQGILQATAQEVRAIQSLFENIVRVVKVLVFELGAGLINALAQAASGAQSLFSLVGADDFAKKAQELATAYKNQAAGFSASADAARNATNATERFASAQDKLKRANDAVRASAGDDQGREGRKGQPVRGSRTFTTAKPENVKAESDKQDAINKAKLALLRAGLEAELNLQKQYAQNAESVLSRAYEQGQIDLQTYVAARIAAAEGLAEQERKLTEQQIAELEKQAAALRAKGKNAEALGIDKDVLNLKAKLVIDEQKTKEQVAKAKVELDKIKDIEVKVRLNTESLTGKVDIDALRSQIEKETASDIATLDQSNPDLANRARQQNEAKIAAAAAKNAVLDVDNRLSELDRRESEINARRTAGLVSERQAQAERLLVYRDQVAAIEERRKVTEKLLQTAESIGDEVAANQFKAQISNLDIQAAGLFAKLNADALAFGSTFAGAFSNAFSAAITGSESLGQALKKNLLNVLETALNKLLNDFFNELISGLIKSQGGGLGGLLKFIPSLFGFADGGIVPGNSPHARADNIPAMLTANEFVQPVKAVQYYGRDYMEKLRTLQIPKDAALQYLGNSQAKIDSARSRRRNYADGGFVDADPTGGGFPVSVSITNNGQPAQVESATSQFDGRQFIVNVVLEELNRGGRLRNTVNRVSR